MQNLFKIFGFIMLFLVIHSCTENIDDSNRYVFKYDTVLSYLQKHEA
jgi:hypothetical protein